MAGGKNSTPVVDPETEDRWRLSRREDLANAFGVILSVPWHGQDQDGRWRFGLTPMGGMPNSDLDTQFQSDMRRVIRQSAHSLVSRGLLTQDEADSLNFHPYSVGPAAQEWPKIFFDLYQDARPFLADGASLLGWGYFLKDTPKAVWRWVSDTERCQSEKPESERVTGYLITANPGVALTRPALIALCYTDLVEWHGVGEDLIVDTFPRTCFPDWENVGHPSGSESYLVRIRAGRRGFFYHVTGAGEVSEHYLLVGFTITPLPIPALTGADSVSTRLRSPPSQQLRLGGTKSSPAGEV